MAHTKVEKTKVVPKVVPTVDKARRSLSHLQLRASLRTPGLQARISGPRAD